MTMAALGMDGLLFDGGSAGISLNTTADLLSLKTTSEEVDGLESSEGSLSRLRLGVEAVRLSPYPTALPSSPPWSWTSGKTVGMQNPALTWI